MINIDDAIELVDAITNEDVVEVKRLVAKNMDLDCVNIMGETPLHIATEIGNLEIIEILIDAGASISFPTFSRETPMIMAIENGNLQVVELLLRKGDNINGYGKYGFTLLQYATLKKQSAIMKFLLEKVPMSILVVQ